MNAAGQRGWPMSLGSGSDGVLSFRRGQTCSFTGTLHHAPWLPGFIGHQHRHRRSCKVNGLLREHLSFHLVLATTNRIQLRCMSQTQSQVLWKWTAMRSLHGIVHGMYLPGQRQEDESRPTIPGQDTWGEQTSFCDCLSDQHSNNISWSSAIRGITRAQS